MIIFEESPSNYVNTDWGYLDWDQSNSNFISDEILYVIDYLCYVVALLRFYCMAKRKKLLVCVCGNWFGTKNGAQTLVGGFLQEIRAESRLICYCTSWQRTPILVGATPAEAVYQAKAQDGGIGKVFPKLRFVYTKAIQLHKVCVNAPPRYWSGQRHNHHSS